MIEVYSKPLDKKVKVSRIIGKYGGTSPGPLAIFLGGMHGNEPSGIFALEYVLHTLNKIKPPFNGTMYALAGNLEALRRSERYIDKDLNRLWDKNGEETGIHELSERDSIIKTIYEIISSSDGRPVLFDLHTTSAESIPFLGISDTLRSRKMVKDIPSPIILGLEERMDGTLFSSLNEIGLTSVIFEGGQHDSLSSIENHISIIWEFLKNAGCINLNDIPDFNKYYHTLAKTSPGERKIYEISYVYRLKKDEGFVMKPGFVNFQIVNKGEILAKNKDGDIKSPRYGNIFMPLYQKLGGEGFFIVNLINPVWLGISGFMRKLHAEKLLGILPGINKNPNEPSSYIINTNIARFLVMNIFHLFGYRRERKEGKTIIVSRREYDSVSPSADELRNNFKKYFDLE